MGKIFSNDAPLTERDYQKARRRFIIADCASFGCCSVLTGQYLGALLLSLGINDAELTFIMTLPQIAQLSMLLVPYLSAKLRFRKKMIIPFMMLEQLPVALLFLFPILRIRAGVFPLAAICYFLYYIGAYMANPLYLQWLVGMSPKDDAARSVYFGKKLTFSNIISVGSLLLVTLLGRQYETDDPVLLYTLIAGIALALYAVKISTYLTIREEPVERPEAPTNPFLGIKEMFTCRSFRPYLIYIITISALTGVMGGISSAFRLNRMALSPSFLSLISVIATIAAIPLSTLWGKIAAKIGFERSEAVALLFFLSYFLIHAFFTPDNAAVLFVISQVLFAIGGSGRDVVGTPYLFECTPPDKRTSFIVFSNLVIVAFSYPISLAGTAIVAAFGEDKFFTLFGMKFTEMHVIYLVCSLLCFLIPLYLFRHAAKNGKARKEGSPTDAEQLDPIG